MFECGLPPGVAHIRPVFGAQRDTSRQSQDGNRYRSEQPISVSVRRRLLRRYAYKHIHAADHSVIIASTGLQIGVACGLGALIKIAVSVYASFDGIFSEETAVATRATLFE